MAEKLNERKEKKEREGEKQGTNEWMKIELDKKVPASMHIVFMKPFLVAVNPLLTPPPPTRILGRSLIETASLFNLA